MDNPEPQFNPPPEPTGAADHYDSLHYVVTAMLVLVTLLAAVVAASLWRIQSDKGVDLANFTAQANNFITQYNRGPGPAQDAFLHKLIDYGRTHTDFMPILTKYGFKPTATTTGAIPPAATPKK